MVTLLPVHLVKNVFFQLPGKGWWFWGESKEINMARKVSAGRALPQTVEHSKKVEAQTVEDAQLQASVDSDKQERNDLYIDTELRVEADDEFVWRIVFSDEAVFLELAVKAVRAYRIVCSDVLGLLLRLPGWLYKNVLPLNVAYQV